MEYRIGKNVDIIFENEHIIVLNKPSGLYSIPDRMQLYSNCKDLLIAKYGSMFTVHRLDADTSGIILFAKTEAAHKAATAQFEQRATIKKYLGIVMGVPLRDTGMIDAPIAEHPAKNGTMIIHRSGKEALTEYRVVNNFTKYSLLEFNILTGRTHQIRIHCKNIGHPIVADALYGDTKGIFLSEFKRKFTLSKDELDERPLLNRLALHAHTLDITLFDQNYTFTAPMPKDMTVAVKQLERWSK
jgi:23S rRNA pseudouridine955/2504/2580 synthase/23S rRNA pseudouridine1911/1915/1917 synthase